jgi:L-iditol 2-dehydrogenase
MNNRNIVVEKIGSFIIKENKLRPCADDEVLLKVEITGLCRTDLKIIESGHRDLILPRVPGEEVVGTIIEKGKMIDRLSIGDLVYVYPGVWCGSCPACKKNAHNLCESMKIMGFHRDGGFAQYVIAPVQSLISVPKNITPSEAVFAEPLSCCLNALEKGRLDSGDKVGIWGGGPAGTLLARAAKLKAESVLVIEPHPERCKRSGGYQSPPARLFDLAIVATNCKDAYQEALTHLAPNGRIVIFSGLAPGYALQPINLDTIHYNEQTIIGAYGCCYRHGVQALELLSSKQIAVNDLISHTLSLWDLKDGLTIVKERSGMKILLDPWKESENNYVME